MLSSGAIEGRIRSLNDIESIVGAMKAYAGVMVRKAEESVRNIRVCEENLIAALGAVAAYHPVSSPPVEGGRVVVAFGSSVGMCGVYNDRVVQAVGEACGGSDSLFVIGRRLHALVAARGIPCAGPLDPPAGIDGVKGALPEIVSWIRDRYAREEYYRLDFVYTAVSEQRAEVTVERVLPPELAGKLPARYGKEPPLLHLGEDELFSGILQEFLVTTLYRCLLESLRSENWYRLQAMEGAADNLKRRTAELRSHYHFARQEEITEEMLEILAGMGASR